MSDPRQEDRERERPRDWWIPTQVMERIRLKLSPIDDGLPFAQAVRNKEEMDKSAKAFRKHLEQRSRKRPKDE